jgi:hypothetical protein
MKKRDGTSRVAGTRHQTRALFEGALATVVPSAKTMREVSMCFSTERT